MNMLQHPDMLELKELLSSHIIKSQEPITLRSGNTTDYYVDTRSALLMSKGLRLAGMAIVRTMMAHNMKVNSIGGIEAGSISIASAMCLLYGYPAFFVRKQAKSYGLKKKIEGNVHSPCIIVEDVVTTGESIMNAVKTVIAEGHEVEAVIAIVDREDIDTKKLFKDDTDGVPFYSIFKAKELKL